jgi:hypothetical protein
MLLSVVFLIKFLRTERRLEATTLEEFKQTGGVFRFFAMYRIQHCVNCRRSDFTVPEDAGIEPRTVATSALAVRRSNTRLELIPIG